LEYLINKNQKPKEILIKNIISIFKTEFEDSIFQITTENEIIFLKCDNKEICNEWIDYINKNLNNLVN
jgi:hypothetical protein